MPTTTHASFRAMRLHSVILTELVMLLKKGHLTKASTNTTTKKQCQPCCYITTCTGLYVEGSLTKGVRDADEAYALLQDGAINSMSIGYRINEEEWDAKAKVNRLVDIELHEVSLVVIPANSEAQVMGVKNADGEVNIRELETVLRDAGLSRKEAKAILADGFKSLDVDEEEELIEKTHDERDAQIEIDNQRLKAMLSKLNSIKSKQSNG